MLHRLPIHWKLGYNLNMPLLDASLDASFWINAHRVGLMVYLSEYFRLHVCSLVEAEILYPLKTAGLPVPAALEFQDWLNAGQVVREDPKQPVDWFQPGENAAIALAMERGYMLLLDDKHPYHRCRQAGIRVVGTADFVLYLFLRGRLDYQAAMNLLVKLQVDKDVARKTQVALEVLARARGVRT